MKALNKRYYTDFTEDFDKTKNQNIKLDDDYKFIRKDFLSRFYSAFIYAVAVIFSYPYCRFFLHVKFEGRKKLKKFKNTGFFLYANHTQPVGDVFTPAHAAFPKRIYTIVSEANYGIPVIGKILPYLGALPILKSVSGIKKLTKSIETRIEEKKCIVIYPEAHVWDYCTFIRPFADTSFKFPAKLSVPVFSMTAVYKKSKVFKKPKAIYYIDGPFYPKGQSLKEKSESLKDQVFEKMTQRSKESNFKYIEYIKKEI